MLLDTCFLIDLQREYKVLQTGPARRFLQDHAKTRFCISVISVTEFLEGFANLADGDRLLRPFTWLPVEASVCREAARIRRHLRMQGNLIGDFDILIAATALISGLSLVSHNDEHFRRIPNLQVLRYI